MNALELLKSKLYISSNRRDEFLGELINSSKFELFHSFGIEYDEKNAMIVNLVADLAHYYYIQNGENLTIPRSIVYRARCLCTKKLTKSA